MMEVPGSLLTAIEHYLAGTATPAEQQLVFDWYHSFNDSEVDIPVPVMELRTRVASRIWSRLEQSMQEQEHAAAIPPVTRGHFRWWQVAAAALLLLVAGLFLFRDNRPNVPNAETVTEQVQDVQPGADRAILTLADGQKIVLDSASNGILTRQGNTQVMKTADGQITYHNSTIVSQTAVLYNTMTTPRGGQFKLTLSDGTEVWLNATSGIRYPTVFRGAAREVQVSGEVYFNVAKNKHLPFRVKVLPAALLGRPLNDESAEGTTLEVLGTQFNIMGYDDEALLKTTLVEGAVNVRHGRTGNAQVIQLRPGQQVQVNKTGNMNVVDQADVEQATAWINGLFQFKDTDIKTLMRQLSRWYDIDVVYEGQVSPVLITGKAPKNISLNTMLKILSLSDIRYRIDGKTLTML